jgi:hypothetical protein
MDQIYVSFSLDIIYIDHPLIYTIPRRIENEARIQFLSIDLNWIILENEFMKKFSLWESHRELIVLGNFENPKCKAKLSIGLAEYRDLGEDCLLKLSRRWSGPLTFSKVCENISSFWVLVWEKLYRQMAGYLCRRLVMPY